MINERNTSLPLLALLGILVFIYHFGVGIYYACGLEPLPSFEFLYTAAFLCGVVWWLKAEARRYAVKPVYCLGLLVSIGWLIIIPYHLFRSHIGSTYLLNHSPPRRQESHSLTSSRRSERYKSDARADFSALRGV